VCLFTCKYDPNRLLDLSIERVSCIGQLAAVAVITVVIDAHATRRYNYEMLSCYNSHCILSLPQLRIFAWLLGSSNRE